MKGVAARYPVWDAAAKNLVNELISELLLKDRADRLHFGVFELGRPRV